MKHISFLKFMLLVILFIDLQQSFGQENAFSISGQYRIRPEFRQGYRTLASDTLKPAIFAVQRARLIFDYKKDNIVSKISIQDTRTWGDEEQKKDFAGLQVNELWLELGLKKGFSLKMGRQELAYDDHRLLGNLDWGNLTISHDALLLKYTNAEKKWNWHLGGAYNQVGEPLFGTKYSLKNYKFLGFTWLKKEMPKINSSLSVLGVLNGLNSTDTASTSPKASVTFGPLYKYNHNAWKALVGAYYQTGKTENNYALSAYMLNLYANCAIKKGSIGLGFDYLSGNSDKTAAKTSQNFSTLYATNHKFYGYMDYFLNIPTDCKSRGLMDVYSKLALAPIKNITPGVDVHYFLLAHENNLGTSKIGRALGTEMDFLVEYAPSPLINLQVGYSMMFASPNMEYLKGGNHDAYNGWAFLMLKVSPTFFKHEFLAK